VLVFVFQRRGHTAPPKFLPLEFLIPFQKLGALAAVLQHLPEVRACDAKQTRVRTDAGILCCTSPAFLVALC